MPNTFPMIFEWMFKHSSQVQALCASDFIKILSTKILQIVWTIAFNVHVGWWSDGNPVFLVSQIHIMME